MPQYMRRFRVSLFICASCQTNGACT